MLKLFKYRAAILLVIFGLATDYAYRASCQRDDVELAAMKESSPVLNSNLAWLSK